MEVMKILQVNVTCGKGSTGVISVEIANVLKSKGHECYIAYGQGSSSYSQSYKIGSYLENKIHGLINTRILGQEGTGTYIGTKRFIKYIESIKPDIIHILTLHSNYLNYELFFSYLERKKIPIVWSFFDCWPFTGKCTHFTVAGCRKWEIECNNCPQLHTSGPYTWFFDRTKKQFNQKKNWCSKLTNLNVIVCSNWLKSEVKKSFLKERVIHMIYNWIDTNKFKEIHDNSVYERYGLDRSKKLLVSVSAVWNDKSTRYSDALRLSELLPEGYLLVIIGKKETKKPILKNMVHINFVNGTDELSKLYTAAIAFVGFSVEDTFGKVFAESMLCGTPAVVFNSTACPEVVGNTGYIVPPHNVEKMLAAIKTIDKNGRVFYSQRCKEHVLSNFGYRENISKYIKIYESLLT